jgi:hypothetical protein
MMNTSAQPEGESWFLRALKLRHDDGTPVLPVFPPMPDTITEESLETPESRYYSLFAQQAHEARFFAALGSPPTVLAVHSPSLFAHTPGHKVSGEIEKPK